MVGILGLGFLSHCDRTLGVTKRRWGVTGGFPTEGFSSGSGGGGFTGGSEVVFPEE